MGIAISSPLPDPVAAVAAALAELPGVVAVTLGGSRATGDERPDSDWDLGLYYRRDAFDPGLVRELGYEGHVSALGEWGPIVDGGAWLTVEGMAVDVLFRDLDVVEGWRRDAEAGRYEVLAQNGYVAGAPTYLPVGELALGRSLAGETLPRPAFPEELAAAAPPRWEGRANVALLFAETHAYAGDAVACAGMLSLAVLCAAHARLTARREWVINEKRLVARAGLEETAEPLGALGDDLPWSVQRVATILGIEPLRVR